MLWEDTMEDLQEIGEVNHLQFGRFLGMFTSLFWCGGGFEGGAILLCQRKTKKRVSQDSRILRDPKCESLFVFQNMAVTTFPHPSGLKSSCPCGAMNKTPSPYS